MDNLQPGQTLGPYRLISQIGQGGMATVYKAYHPAMDRHVAIKILPSRLAQNAEFVSRFQREAHTIANLEHPHILPVHDYGESEGISYLAMRYLEAGTLKERIQADPLSPAEIDRYFSQIAAALGYAHKRGVIHRDIKPSNVLVDTNGDIFLTDFGIAKLLEHTTQLTATGALTGTPAYMSPEQGRGETVDLRSDIYSLAIILYEMLTGRAPFEADTPWAIMYKHQEAPLPLPSTIKQDVSPAVEQVLLKALAKNRNDRFASCEEFLAAWKKALQTEATISRPIPVTPDDKRRLTTGWLVGGLILGIGGLGALMVVVLATIFLWSRLADSSLVELSSTPATTAVPPLSAGEPGWTSWTAANSIENIYVDGDEIYTAGMGGVTVWNRNDGVVLRHYTSADGLPAARAHVVMIDPEGTLWVGTPAGLARLDEDEEEWIIYDSDDGLDGEIITALVHDGDTLLVGTHYSDSDGGGLNLFDGRRWQPAPNFPSVNGSEDLDDLSNYVNVILSDGDGGYLVGTENGLAYFDGEEWQQFSTADGLPDNRIYSLLIDTEDTWIVGTAAGVAWFDDEQFQPLTQGGPRDVVNQIVQDERERLWFAGGGGIWRFDPATANWHEFNQTTGDLPVYSLYAAAQDEEGHLYFGGENSGLLQYDGQTAADHSFEAWRAPNSPVAAAFAHIIPAPDGTFWFMEEYGSQIDRYDPRLESWQAAPELPCSCMPAAFDQEGNLWAFQGDGGVWIIDPAGGSLHLEAEIGLMDDNRATALAFSRDGRLVYIGTSAGLVILDRQTREAVTTIDLLAVGATDGFVRSILETADGSLWVGLNAGASRRDPTGSWQHFNVGDPFTSHLPGVFTLVEDTSGALWLGTWGEGAYRLANGRWEHFDPYQASTSIPSDQVTNIHLAPDGSLWFATGRGAARFTDGRWTTHGRRDGLIHENVNAIYVDNAGTVWLATSGGITRYRP